MKKLLLTLLCICGILRADSSDRLAVFYLGAGVNGSYTITHITELIPVTYTDFDQNNQKDVVNKMCKSGTCIDGSLGGGISGEIGVKLRPAKILEFDIWGSFDLSFMLGNSYYPNAITLKDFSHDYKYDKYPNSFNRQKEYATINTTLMNISLNATATLRLWRFGIIGGIGGSFWGQNYDITLKDQFSNSSDKTLALNGSSLNLIGGISVIMGPNKGTNEMSLRVVVPITSSKHMTNLEGDGSNLTSNGYVTYKEKIVMQPYMLNLSYRYFF